MAKTWQTLHYLDHRIFSREFLLRMFGPDGAERTQFVGLCAQIVAVMSGVMMNGGGMVFPIWPFFVFFIPLPPPSIDASAPIGRSWSSLRPPNTVLFPTVRLRLSRPFATTTKGKVSSAARNNSWSSTRNERSAIAEHFGHGQHNTGESDIE